MHIVDVVYIMRFHIFAFFTRVRAPCDRAHPCLAFLASSKDMRLLATFCAAAAAAPLPAAASCGHGEPYFARAAKNKTLVYMAFATHAWQMESRTWCRVDVWHPHSAHPINNATSLREVTLVLRQKLSLYASTTFGPLKKLTWQHATTGSSGKIQCWVRGCSTNGTSSHHGDLRLWGTPNYPQNMSKWSLIVQPTKTMSMLQRHCNSHEGSKSHGWQYTLVTMVECCLHQFLEFTQTHWKSYAAKQWSGRNCRFLKQQNHVSNIGLIHA